MAKINRMDYASMSLMLIELLVKYGPNIFLRIVQTLEPGDITPEKIRTLIVKEPETYFEEV